jgi:hypothetical protein
MVDSGISCLASGMLVFVGYSFADADVELKFLLRLALTQKAKPPTVVVVTKSEKKENAYD